MDADRGGGRLPFRIDPVSEEREQFPCYGYRYRGHEEGFVC